MQVPSSSSVETVHSKITIFENSNLYLVILILISFSTALDTFSLNAVHPQL